MNDSMNPQVRRRDEFGAVHAEWEAFYNYHRPHGALGGQTPYERLRQKTADPLS